MKKHAWLNKGVRMNKNRFAKRVTLAAGYFFLCATPGLTRAQSSPPVPAHTSHMASPAARPKSDARPTDDFAGLIYTDEQKTRIDQVHQEIKSRMDTVAKDAKLTVEQKDAMLSGYQRMERSQVFKVLTTAQQREVLKRVRARHVAEQQDRNKQSLPN